MSIPGATYRLQLNAEFGFDQAGALASYLAELGVTHVYLSPILKARAGSTHGYDTVAFDEISRELGGRTAYERMSVAFQRHGLKQIVDFVPNHMGVRGAANRWWQDILEWGRESPHAPWFDIDWAGPSDRLRGKVLLPLLGEDYRSALTAGRLVLRFDEYAGSFFVVANDDDRLPISPRHYDRILRRGTETAALASSFADLAGAPDARTRALLLKAELAVLTAERPAALAAITDAAGSLGVDELDALIAGQHWVLASYLEAAEINYRRFFDVSDLAGIRMEVPDVFDRAHALIFDLIERDFIHGLRIDHIDGLYDPAAYCRALREQAPRPIYVVVEKILGEGERLPEEWGGDGTTGYEFANLVTRLLLDPSGEAGLAHSYADFVGRQDDPSDVIRAAKLQVMGSELAAEIGSLTAMAAKCAEVSDRVAIADLRRAIVEMIAAFPVYRTYTDAGPIRERDQVILTGVVKEVRQQVPDLDPRAVRFIEDLLVGDGDTPDAIAFRMRFQQTTGPVMAKGLEDTAFYRLNRLLALNEVGGDPRRFGVGIADFHRANAERLVRFPHSLLATATHDTKRGEDGRARLAALSELPEEWAAAVSDWRAQLRALTGPTNAADPNDEYMFYQLLLAAWPADLAAGRHAEQDGLRLLTDRLQGAMLKSIREAKVRTSWLRPNAAYEETVAAFVRGALDPRPNNRFLASFAEFLTLIAPLGVRNSLIQLVLKLTVPGVPDLYRGTELWDWNLVDPDNRRGVDYALRQRLLAEDSRKDPSAAELLSDWHDGRIKLRTARRILRFRKKNPMLFEEGSYEPMEATGSGGQRICAFLRQHEGAAIFVAVALFSGRQCGRLERHGSPGSLDCIRLD